MAEDQIRFIGDLQRVDVKPGDKFVLSVDSEISEETARYIGEKFSYKLGAEVIVLSKGVKLGVIGAQE